MNEQFARKELTKTCKALYDRNLTVSAGGNMSVRLNEREFIITPSGRNKGNLNPHDMVKMNVSGKVLSDGKPSIEHKFHIELYKANPDTNSVIHCHPLYCVALALTDTPIKSNLTPEGILLLGDVPIVKYHTPGSKNLSNDIAKHSTSLAMLLSKHGAITQGKSLEEAFNRMEELEFQAKLQTIAINAEELPAKEVEKIKKL